MSAKSVYAVAGPNGAGKTTQDKAELAMKSAVRKVIAEHKKSGRPLAVWENGKVVRIPADKL